MKVAILEGTIQKYFTGELLLYKRDGSFLTAKEVFGEMLDIVKASRNKEKIIGKKVTLTLEIEGD